MTTNGLILQVRVSFLAALMSLVLAGAAHAELKVVTTFTVIADIAQNVAGDAATVEAITRHGANIHTYSPTPRDLLKAQNADLILWNGLNLELWFEQFFGNLRDVPEVVVSDGVEPISISSGPYDGKPNPHAWMSSSDVKIYIANIRDALSELDPENAATYAANARTYMDEIDTVMAEARAVIDALPDSARWLVTSEGAFSYLTRDLGLKELSLWPINADQQGTPQQVRRVIDIMRDENIGVIFSESTVPADPAQQVARETGAHYGGVLYVDSLTDESGPAPTYIDLLRTTVATIAEGLSAAESRK